MWNFPLFPDQASTMAKQVDALYFFELGIAGFFTALDLRVDRDLRGALSPESDRRSLESSDREQVDGSALDRSAARSGNGHVRLGGELSFSAFTTRRGDALEVAVVAKQWMWHLQHAEGRSEINELHVPLGRPVKLHDDLAGCDPQLLCTGVSSEAGRAAGPLYVALVRADHRWAAITCIAPNIAGRIIRRWGDGLRSWSRLTFSAG